MVAFVHCDGVFVLLLQLSANTPDSVFQVLEYLKQLLLLLHQNYLLPALAYTSSLLQQAWISLQESCKSVNSKCRDYSMSLGFLAVIEPDDLNACVCV